MYAILTYDTIIHLYVSDYLYCPMCINSVVCDKQRIYALSLCGTCFQVKILTCMLQLLALHVQYHNTVTFIVMLKCCCGIIVICY